MKVCEDCINSGMTAQLTYNPSMNMVFIDGWASNTEALAWLITHYGYSHDDALHLLSVTESKEEALLL